ncbi:MAG: TfoX/Sxy family protein [Acidobacteriota bacterium]|nr:TfoX/Sxy family protein [Acidobacteriota bacterium]MDH3528580.1 TfoX/Sxy family protein [Acidobacteriota bacterium]
MGEKDAKHTGDAESAANSLVDTLSEIGEITSKKMFGGHGIFHDGRMFGIIDPDGQAFLKADDYLEDRFLEAGSEKHGRMPYYLIPGSVMADSAELLQWAKDSIRASKNEG